MFITFFFFFNDTATTEIYTLSLHDALPIFASFRGESALGSWLYRLTVNVVFLHLRGARRRSLRVLTTDDPSALERPAGEEGESGRPAVALDLERAVAGLPPGARQVFVLHDVEGYRHEEIARLTGVAVGTSKAQLFRARRLLREEIGRAHV